MPSGSQRTVMVSNSDRVMTFRNELSRCSGMRHESNDEGCEEDQIVPIDNSARDSAKLVRGVVEIQCPARHASLQGKPISSTAFSPSASRPNGRYVNPQPVAGLLTPQRVTSLVRSLGRKNDYQTYDH